MPIAVLVPAKYARRSRRSTRTVFARENRGAFHVNPQMSFRFFYDQQLWVVGAGSGPIAHATAQNIPKGSAFAL